MIHRKQSDKSSNRKRIYQAAGTAVVVLVLFGIFLPGRLLIWQSKIEMDMVDAVPMEYYSPANLAVARNASANLGVYQKLQLITGRWESNLEQTDSFENELENYEAAALAKEQIDVLYRKKLYPVSLLSAYGNWYSWRAEPRKVVDATFHTYGAYYWDILFEKYDGSERHQIYMLEDGTVFLADAWEKDDLDISSIIKISDLQPDPSLEQQGVVKQEISEENRDLEGYFAFLDIETADLQWLDMQQLRVGKYKYDVFQAYSANRYLYSLQPAD